MVSCTYNWTDPADPYSVICRALSFALGLKDVDLASILRLLAGLDNRMPLVIHSVTFGSLVLFPFPSSSLRGEVEKVLL